MFGYRVISRMTSRKDGVGEVVVSKDKTTPLILPLDIIGGTNIAFREPDESWREKCTLQNAEWAIPKKEMIKLVVFMHFGGMYYRYDPMTSTLHIRHLTTAMTGYIVLILAILLIWQSK